MPASSHAGFADQGRRGGKSLGREQIAAAKQLLQKSQRLVVITGAGMSAESGVPTFRGVGAGLLDVGMPIEAFLSASNFRRDSLGVWRWHEALRAMVAAVEPHAGHVALATWEQRHPRRATIITQNIDGLHERAGSRDVLDMHGSAWRTRCEACNRTYDERRVPVDPLPPGCPTCDRDLRPDVVLYEEVPRYLDESFAALATADTVLVVGTSGLVYPAAGFVPLAKRLGAAVIEVNRERTPNSRLADVRLSEPAGVVLPDLLSS